METDVIEQVTDKPDSIKVARNAAGKYSFEVKMYYDSVNTTPDVVLDTIKQTYSKLEQQYNQEG